jgi:hypothetical protein
LARGQVRQPGMNRLRVRGPRVHRRCCRAPRVTCGAAFRRIANPSLYLRSSKSNRLHTNRAAL